ncbi:VOC family protein [Rugamonas sp. FT82W]|uniref:VOC family protein n=1 Tax=Duganella vulcania TaxID=2692166 RepID=A0A845G2D6_9BURK|nr:VOC family protein [Duganella vulcania]
MSRIDHITVTAPTLAAGAAFVFKALGAAPQPGGEHPRMGTHNLLLRLGDALFLEIIAPNPDAPPPGRPRWFALDHLALDSPPSLGTWVARTADIRATAAASSEDLGAVEPMSRGQRNWLITIPADGSIALDGVAPALIEWDDHPHPAAGLQDHGLSLASLEIFHPDPQRAAALMASIGLKDAVACRHGDRPRLVAHINTPQGIKELST